MKIEEIIGALLAGMVAGAVLGIIQAQWPESGIGGI